MNTHMAMVKFQNLNTETLGGASSNSILISAKLITSYDRSKNTIEKVLYLKQDMDKLEILLKTWQAEIIKKLPFCLFFLCILTRKNFPYDSAFG
jgi:hypothetical protein